MKELKKIKIRYRGRVVDAFLLCTYTRACYHSEKTFFEKLFCQKTNSKLTTKDQRRCIVFIPWKHQAKQTEEIAEADILQLEEPFPKEWITVPEYTSTAPNEYCSDTRIRDFFGYPFIYHNNSFIADQICGIYDRNLKILYAEIPELLIEEFDEEVF